jgi:hypothetical protein
MIFMVFFLIKSLVNGLNWLYSFCQLVITSSKNYYEYKSDIQ